MVFEVEQPMRKIEPKKMTATERKHWGFGVDAIRMMENELMGYLHEYRALPLEWDEIWKDEDRRDPKRTRVTIRLDADVVKYFRAMGAGYQARINRVLRAYMHFRLAKLVEGPDTMDYILRPEEVLASARARPDWGDAEAHNAKYNALADETRGQVKKTADRVASPDKASPTGAVGPQKQMSKDTQPSWSTDPLDGPKDRTGR
ncbi:hypothetical protein OAN307_c09930 [Octadecabacter antarcticus 307]|uniref:BrnA antitoxin of type II toxin-antitoxin system n=2 Tax=Octadecabacter TaxID=53945 RepID=M9R4K7_9RHOB|nr:hypothetical protein OAN307_c09930 [Octadecabacter antarcticus 307]